MTAKDEADVTLDASHPTASESGARTGSSSLRKTGHTSSTSSTSSLSVLSALSSRSSVSGASRSRTKPGAAARTAEEVMQEGYRAVLRLYSAIMFWGSVCAIPLLVLGRGGLGIRVLTGAALAGAICVYGYGYLRTRDEAALQLKVPFGLLLLLVCCGVTLHYGLGFYSGLPFVVMLGIGVLILTVAAPNRDGLFVYAAGAIAYGIWMSLVAAGVVPAQGLLAGEVDMVTMWTSAIGMQIGLAAAYLFGRLMAGYGQQIVEQLSRAARDAFRREALLSEARADLLHAERAVAAGLFSELELDVYRLGDLLGRGGMGEVYAAVHMETGDPAAVKLLRRDALGDREAVQRFAREAMIAAELTCPEVVRVYSVSGPEAPLPYIAMEFLNGRDLSQALRSKRRRRLGEVVEMVCTVCRGLSAAHARGIVHRDLKPQNIFLCEDAADGGDADSDEGESRVRFKILDFGVSKLVGRQERTLGEGQLVGTPAYMAPEQALGQSVDHTADLYSLCVVAYRCLTGFPAFPRGRPTEVMAAVIRDMPEDPATLVKLPDDVRSVLRVGLAKSPRDRFPDAETLGQAFRDAAAGELDERWRAQARVLSGPRPWGPADGPDSHTTSEEREVEATRRV